MTPPRQRGLPPGAWSGPTGKTTYAIASDLSGVVETVDGFGSFKTELEALDQLISMLEGERADIADRIAAAKRRRSALRRKK